MARQSSDQYDEKGFLVNGFDYVHQAWVKNGRYVRCGHPEIMRCNCWGRIYEGAECTRTEAMNYQGVLRGL